jgi:hypothetical protein
MKFERITLKRLPGMAGGPRCVIEVSANRNVHTKRYGYPNQNGMLFGEIPDNEIHEIENYLDQVGLSGEKDYYDYTTRTCCDTCQIDIELEGNRHKTFIRDPNDQSVPSELLALENKIKSLALATDLRSSHNYPICGRHLRPIQRHPSYVCQHCAAKATDSDGRQIEFFNTDFSGGYGARYVDNGEPYNSHICYIKDELCRADEARFGGIVIEDIESGSQLSFDEFVAE